MNGQRQCIRCQRLLDISCFHKCPARKDGLWTKCKECRSAGGKARYQEKADAIKERMKNYYQQNIDVVRQRTAAYQRRNPEKKRKWKANEMIKYPDRVRARQRAGSIRYRVNNIDKARANQTRYTQRHPERIRARTRRYRERTKEIQRDRYRQYWRAHPEAVLAWNHARRARVRNAEGRFTAQEWTDLKARYNYTCLRCGKCEPEIKLSVDHVIPLHHGGSNYISNIQPLCKPCNSIKHVQVIDYRH